MEGVLAVEEPQLVVLNGDLITGENTYLENSTDYLDRIVAPLVRRDLRWASTYGNHGELPVHDSNHVHLDLCLLSTALHTNPLQIARSTSHERQFLLVNDFTRML